MPILNVSISCQPNEALTAAIADELSAATKLHLHKDPSLTAVIINHIAPENWIVGGASLASQRLSSFWLDIKITAGTNTKVELSNYMEAVFVKMGGILGLLHETSYIMVHEVQAAAWGYAGKTQEFRFISGTITTTV